MMWPTRCICTMLLAMMIAIGANAHGQLTVPRIRLDPEGREVSWKQRAPVYTLSGPTGGYSATSMRCHDFSAGSLTTVTAGSSLTISHAMLAAHPGDCYLYISYDGANPVNFFKIAAMKGCGAPNGLSPPTPYTTTVDLPAALPPCDHCVLRWEWTAHHQVVDIEFYVQCADIKIVSTAGPTKPNPMVAISGIAHLPSSISSYRNPYNGEFGDQWLVGPNIASFSSCSAGSAGCVGAGTSTTATTSMSTIATSSTTRTSITNIMTSTSSTTITIGSRTSSNSITSSKISTSSTSSTSITITTTPTLSRTTSSATMSTTAKTTPATTGLSTSTTLKTMTASTNAPGTTTMLSSTTRGSCDNSCTDSMDSAACRHADLMWNMCSAGSSWWISRCQATCARCGGVLPPCGQCDHKCTNTQPGTECARLNRSSAGALCSGGWGTWWLNQCRASCGACDGTLPPCSQTVQFQSFSTALLTGLAPSNNSAPGTNGPTPAKDDQKPSIVVMILGISNGILLLCLLASGCVIITGRHTKKFEL